MNKLTKILISATTAIIALGGFASVAFAQPALPPLDVHFQNEPLPLFNVSNFMPGDIKEATITVGNNDDVEHGAYIEAVNVSNDDNLASQMKLEMFDGSTSIYDNNFGTFLNAGPVSLSLIDAGGSKTFNLKITFIESTNNDYQGKTLGFDICVGFSGGNLYCTNEVATSTEEGTTSSGGGSGGSGGSSGGSHRLVISNENASNILADGDVLGSGIATITWETNIPATSQAVYGPVSGVPYSFDINNQPNFGYPSGTNEDLTKVINHSMLLTNLDPGQTYKYRVISRASPATISYEHEFTVPIPSGVSNTITSASPAVAFGEGGGEILGASAENNGTSTIQEIAGIFNKENLAAAITAGWSDLISRCSLLALLILLVAYVIWRFILRPRYERNGLPREEIKRKSYIFFGLFSALAIIVAFVLGQYCPIPIFITALLLSLGLYVYNVVK